MYRGIKTPATSKHGLIIPPQPVDVTPEITKKYGTKAQPDRHHIYFPRVAFGKTGSLEKSFREHPFNSIYLPRFQHERLHQRYDRLVQRYPGILIPKEDVMVAFLDEAELLDSLKVSMRAIDMIDDALYEGRVVNVEQSLENRVQRLCMIDDTIKQAAKLCVIPQLITAPIIAQAKSCITQAA